MKKPKVEHLPTRGNVMLAYLATMTPVVVMVKGQRFTTTLAKLEIGRSQIVVNNLPARKCCRRKMGLTPDYTDAHHWRYQCDKNPDHCQDIMITIGPS